MFPYFANFDRILNFMRVDVYARRMGKSHRNNASLFISPDTAFPLCCGIKRNRHKAGDFRKKQMPTPDEHG